MVARLGERVGILRANAAFGGTATAFRRTFCCCHAGTGKTLIARQIGKMLNGKEPKIVNGPEVLNKYVGASEENIRNLFKDAEAEYQKMGEASGAAAM